jgi:hypothetical protein
MHKSHKISVKFNILFKMAIFNDATLKADEIWGGSCSG